MRVNETLIDNVALYVQGYVERNHQTLREDLSGDELTAVMVQVVRAAIVEAATETFVNPEAMIAKGGDLAVNYD